MNDDGDRDAEDAYLRTGFLERLAHELRGPAGVIQGALDELASALGEDAQKYEAVFAMARRGVRRITRNADRLQQTGFLERGDLRLQREPCNLSELLARCVEDARILENRRQIEVDVRLPSQPLISKVDLRWMGIVFYELASNTIRHASTRAEVSLMSDTNGFAIAFDDDNPKATPFAPARFQSTREARGLGLALAIARDVVEAHGGGLEISRRDPSGAAEGARVRVRVPHDAQVEDRQAVSP